MIYGGPAVVVFGLILAFMVQSVITLGLSELASAFPVKSPTAHSLCVLTLLAVIRRTIPLLLHSCSCKAQTLYSLHHRLDVRAGMVDCDVWIPSDALSDTS